MTLIQRGKTGNYSVKFSHRGRQIMWSTGTADKAEARRRAKAYIEQTRSENVEVLKAVAHRGHMTFASTIDLYLEKADVTMATRRQNVRVLKLIIDSCGLTPQDSVTKLTVEVLEDWQRRRIEYAAKQGRESEEKARRTINSLWTQAKSIWCRRMKRHYSAEPPALQACRVRSTAVQFILPDEGLVQKTIDTFMSHCRPEFRSLFILCYYGGLRMSEALNATTEWLRPDGLVVETSESFTTKTKKDRTVPLKDTLLAQLAENAGDRYLIRGNRGIVYREACRLMRKLGWNRDKSFHELRKVAGSRVVKAQGLKYAQKFLGHASIATTAQYYADVELKPLEL